MSPSSLAGRPVLCLEGITKRFGALLANDAIDLELWAGEVLALLGENGAGKTTLMNILFGHYVADQGRVVMADGSDWRELPAGSPTAALRAGSGMSCGSVTASSSEPAPRCASCSSRCRCSGDPPVACIRRAAMASARVALIAGAPSSMTQSKTCGRSSTPMRIERMPGLPDVHAVLAFPSAPCPTGAVYGKFDLMRPDASVEPARVRELARARTLAADAPFNDLAGPAIAVEPSLEDDIDEVRAATQRPVHVSGSGSTLYVLCNGRLEADLLAEQVRERAGLPAAAASVRGL